MHGLSVSMGYTCSRSLLHFCVHTEEGDWIVTKTSVNNILLAKVIELTLNLNKL